MIKRLLILFIFVLFCAFSSFGQSIGDTTSDNQGEVVTGEPGENLTGAEDLADGDNSSENLESIGKSDEKFIETGDYLFITSSPIRASVSIGGKDTGLITPCIVREKKLDLSIITVKKDGFKEYRLTVDEIQSKSAQVSLVPLSFDLFFPKRTTYKVGNTLHKGPVYVSKLRQGNYSIKVLNDKITFAKISPFTPFEVLLGTTSVLSLGGMVSTIALSEVMNYNAYLNREGDEIDYEFYKRSTQYLDYTKFAFIGVFSFFTSALIAIVAVDLHFRFKQKKGEMEISSKLPVTEDTTFYETALQFLGAGDLERSTQVLLSMLSMFPQSDFIPLVYYQLGQNYYITGDVDRAVTYWEVFLRDYPLNEYYDYVIKSFADIYFARGEFELAYNTLSRILFTGGAINRESIYSFKGQIDVELFQKTGKQEYFERAESQYGVLIDEFTQSERLDVYFLLLVKLYKSVNAVDKLDALVQKVDTLPDTVDESIKKIILSYF